ncbi:MAG: BACON domain-containing protein [Odoribacter splanchnicus]
MIAKLLYRLYGIVTIGCILLCPALSGCDDDTVSGFLQFSDDNLLLKAAGDTVVIDVTAGSGWKAESMADWCTVEEKQGETEEKLVIRVSPSDDIYERGTAVKVTCGDNVVRLSVRQEPMVFEVTDGKKTLNFTKKVATDTLKIHTNMAWEVEIADTTGWLQVTDTIGSGDAELIFTTTDNSQKKGRSTTVRLRYGVRTLKLTASQDGGIRVDGHIRKHYGEREPENGFNLIFLGDGFTSDDLIAETGVFDLAVEEACEALFAVEPYKTYKEYFNVWSVACESQERGAGTSESGNTALLSYFNEDNHRIIGSNTTAFSYAAKILGMNDDILKTNSVVIVLVNDKRYGGSTYWFGNPTDRNDTDYRAISYVPLNRDIQLPGGFTNIFLHEVGGHAIGKLGDEWSTEQLFTTEDKTLINNYKNCRLYCYNLGLPTSAMMVSNYPQYSWTFFQYVSGSTDRYSGVLKPADGGYGCVSDIANKAFVSHCEEESCMINNVPYFNVASRYAIVQWLLFRLNVYEYTPQGMTGLVNYFFEHDQYELPADYTVSDRPPLPMPAQVE